MAGRELNTYSTNTWCGGCGNFTILTAIKNVLGKMAEEELKKVVVVSGIGCNSKISDYLNVNTFYSLHGRAIPAAEGIKLANPDLKVIVFVGDGDVYGEGLEHLIFAAKRNTDITVVVHDNRVYGLTTGQYTPTSPLGYKGRSTPLGTVENPINPLELMYAVGATFIARAYSAKIQHMQNLMEQAVVHKGFSFIEVLQPCFTFYNTFADYNARIYELQDHNPKDASKAEYKIMEWDYNSTTAKIPLGLFYQTLKPTFEKLVYDELHQKK